MYFVAQLAASKSWRHMLAEGAPVTSKADDASPKMPLGWVALLYAGQMCEEVTANIRFLTVYACL